MSDKSASFGDVVDAIVDLTRVTVAFSGKCDTKSDAIRRLSELSIPPGRVAAILSMSTKDVSSVLAKQAKKAARVRSDATAEEAGGLNA